jgi:exopolysaccharide production protein ExoQ
VPPSLALVLWLVLLIALLCFDPAKERKTSLALWVPVIWMFIVASRLPSQWLVGQAGIAAQALEEGNPIDRGIDIALMLSAIFVLVSRSFRWADFFARNLALTAFLSFALLSVMWSDFALIAFKRWARDLGNFLVVLVALSDRRPLEAVRTLFRRLGYLLIPLSILLVKYYPEIGKQYEVWQGTAMYSGPATSKNGLGVICLVSGIFFFWDTVTRWSDRKQRRTKQIICVNLALFAMTLWLLNLANSATSRVCLAIGCLVIMAHSTALQRRPAVLKALIPALLCLYPILAFGFGMSDALAAAAGRDPTFTTRTEIWEILLGMHTNPLVGTGYESFWLGPRLRYVWSSPVGTINEAHNGYLEVYLSLGIVGLFLLSAFLVASYRTICKRLNPFPSIGSLSLALWTVALFYNVTEAAFKVHFMWVALLVVAIAVPGLFEKPRSAGPGATEPLRASAWKYGSNEPARCPPPMARWRQ